jgi:hypothetical protein
MNGNDCAIKGQTGATYYEKTFKTEGAETKFIYEE